MKSPTQTPTCNGGVSHHSEAEAYWDRLTADDRRLIRLTASGKDAREIAAECAETPRKMTEQFGHGRLEEADKSKMKTAQDLTAKTTPSGKALSADGGAITGEQYAAAFAAGYTRTSCFLLSRGCSPTLADEISQSAWARGWEHHLKLREPGKVLPWVNSIALNLFRSEFRRREVAEPVPDVPVAPQTGPGAIDAHRILEQCSVPERALLRKHAAGYTSREIAKQMGCPPVTVRVRLVRLKHRLRTIMTARPAGQICD